MVFCTLTKKAHIYCMCKEGQKFTEIANTLGLNSYVVSCNFCKIDKQGPNPDFYAKPLILGKLRAISPVSECLAMCAINSGEFCDATAVQCKLLPHLHPTTIRQKFIRKGLHGHICWKKPWLSKKHICT